MFHQRSGFDSQPAMWQVAEWPSFFARMRSVLSSPAWWPISSKGSEMLKLLTILISALAFSVGTIGQTFAADKSPKKEAKKDTKKEGKKIAITKKRGVD
jgi:hypothetical protein